ncbi:hypothetical protein Egran_04144 [Elaphomyces granulatus]|uniref:C2H2-type domain-containing protein n=1 Tax=Elaphomyces granulatus TaxID=519963 RepID=A0A232LVF7_9EURO|nr:hypothetical protein Egran_04144 [Elaphomyces granulatus]
MSYQNPQYPLYQHAPQNASPMFPTGFQPTVSSSHNSGGQSPGYNVMGSQASLQNTPFAQGRQLDSSYTTSGSQNVFQSQPFPSTQQSSLLTLGPPPFPVPALVSASTKQPNSLSTSISQHQEQSKPGHVPGCDVMRSQNTTARERQLDSSKYTTSKNQNVSQSQPFPSTNQSSSLTLGPPPFPVPAVISASTPLFRVPTKMKQPNALSTSISQQEQPPINATGRSHATNESQQQQYDSNTSNIPVASVNIYQSPYVQPGVPQSNAPKSQTSAEVGVDQMSYSSNSTSVPPATANDTAARRSNVLASEGPRTSAPDLMPANTSPESSDVHTAEPEPVTQAGTPNGDMAIEMRKMISKLQEWRRKDPGLFSKVWDDLKKGQLPNENVPSQSSPQKLARPQATTNTSSNAVAGISSDVTKPAVVPAAVQQPAPKSSQLGSKQYALAQAASEYLTNDPLNKNRPVSVHMLMSILDGNPSYLDLCKQLESQKISLHIGKFAKHLLVAVPDLNSESRNLRSKLESMKSTVKAQTKSSPAPPPPPASPTSSQVTVEPESEPVARPGSKSELIKSTMSAQTKDLEPSPASPPPSPSNSTQVTVEPQSEPVARAESKFESTKSNLSTQTQDLNLSSAPPPPAPSTGTLVTVEPQSEPVVRPESKSESIKLTSKDLKPSSEPPPLAPSTDTRVTAEPQSGSELASLSTQTKDMKPSSATPPSPAPSTGITAEPQSGPVARPGESTKSTLSAESKDLNLLSLTPLPPTPSTGTRVTVGPPAARPRSKLEPITSTLRAQTKDLKPTSAPAPLPPSFAGTRITFGQSGRPGLNFESMKSTLRDLRPSSAIPPRSTGSRVTVRPRSGSKYESMKSTLRNLKPSSTPPPPPVPSTGSRVTRSGPVARSESMKSTLRDLKPASTPPPPYTPSPGSRVTVGQQSRRPAQNRSPCRALQPKLVLLPTSKSPPLAPSTGTRVTVGPQSGPVAWPDQNQSLPQVQQPKLVPLSTPPNANTSKSPTPAPSSTGTEVTSGPQSGPVTQPDQNHPILQPQLVPPLSIPQNVNASKSPPPASVLRASPSGPGPKETTARKRVFSEIIDLTTFSDEDTGASRRPPGIRHLEVPSSSTMSNQSPTATKDQQSAPAPTPTAEPPPAATTNLQPTKDQQPAPAPTPIADPPPAATTNLQRPDITPAASQASLSKSPIATPIATTNLQRPDIISATSQRPDIIPAASQVNLSKIASTPSNETSREALRKRYDIIKPLDKANALWRPSYHRDTIARDILIASGRHPTERPLNQHLQGLLDRFQGVNNKSDLETFGWDLIDPGGPPMPVVKAKDILVELSKAAGSREKGPARDSPRFAQSAALFSPGQQQPQSSGQSHSSPRLNGKAPDQSGKVATTRMDLPDPKGRPSRPGTKNKHPPKAPSRAAAVKATQSEAAIARTSSPPASYATYQCRWEGCQAELHDLSTLEKHVAKNHVPGHRFCRWRRCPNSQLKFVNDGLGLHLHKAHISPMAWKLGDGPSVAKTVIDPERYLSDSHGSLVTPEAASAGDVDSLIFPVGNAPIHAFNKMHGNQSNVEKAREVLKAVQHRQRKIGFGLEQGGCELAGPVRNSVMAGDEDFFAVVPIDRRSS